MNSELLFQSSFCKEYDALLHRCESAQSSWSRWRDEMNSLVGMPPVAVTEELLRLQAKFAKSYAQLEKHQQQCELCRFVAKVSKSRDEFACAPSSAEETWLV
ncbi:MAG TPA: hypothetical protein VKH45_03870 [Candidatus Acidoferrum sp.]|nr:hypothetical protein [Candidatus Acidoferrum sp.]